MTSFLLQISVFVTLQAAAFTNPLLSVALANASQVFLAWNEATLFQAILLTLQRQLFPGAERNFLGRLVAFIKRRGFTHLLINTAHQEFLTDLFNPFPLEIRNVENV